MAVAIVIWFLPNRDKTLTVIGLVVLGCLVLYPLLGLTYLRDAAGLTRFVRFVLVVGVISVVMVVFGIVVWPPMSLGKLSSSEADAFIKELNTQSVPIIVNLMCPPNDERDCTVGAQFIDLFRRARWTVRDNIVHRVFNGHPKAGLYFVLRSTVDPDPGNPEGKTGAWTQMPNAYFTVKAAFDALTMTELVVGADYPDHELGIYFGYGTASGQ